MNLVDSSGWIEYFSAGKNLSFFAKPIEQTDQLLVPVICIYEVFKKVAQVDGENEAIDILTQMKEGHVIPISEEITLRAVTISLESKLAMADSILLATAHIYKATLWTQDVDFKGLAGVKYTKK